MPQAGGLPGTLQKVLAIRMPFRASGLSLGLELAYCGTTGCRLGEKYSTGKTIP
jgi:hypothetical protein